MSPLLRSMLALGVLAGGANGFSLGHQHTWGADELDLSEEASSVEGGDMTDKDFFKVWAPTMLAVPRLKLLFCFIPKNACTQFNLLMNSLNGIDGKLGDVCTKQDPNFWSQWAEQLRTHDGDRLKDLLGDPTWMKAVFFRDPLERLVSGYKSKCAPPIECGGCMNFPHVKAKTHPSFDEFVSKLDQGDDVHFNPQVSMCGGLSEDVLRNYSYIGRVSNNYTHVAEQVRDMMTMAVNRSRNVQDPIAGDRVLQQVETYFPASGPTTSATHVHHTDNVDGFFRESEIREKAMEHYARDYELLNSLA